MVVFGLALATFTRIGAEIVLGDGGIAGDKFAELLDIWESLTKSII